MAARLADANVEEVTIDVPAGESRTARYLALNPMGKVPTLVLDDGRVLLESYAIGVALCSGTSALPEDRLHQALQWMFFDACHMSPPLGTLTFQNMFAPQPDPGTVDRATAEWKRYAAVLEKRLGNRQFLLGDDGPTLADISLLASLTYAERASFPLEGFEQIQRWRTTLEGLPAALDTMPGPPR